VRRRKREVGARRRRDEGWGRMKRGIRGDLIGVNA